MDIGAVITETEGIADDESCDALGSRIAVAKTPATAKTVPTARQEARHLNLRRDPELTGTTPLCPPTGEARTRSNALFLSPLHPGARRHPGGKASGARGPGRHSRVATPAWIVPGTGERVAILVECAFVVRRGVPLAHPNGEGVILDLVRIVQRLAFREAVVARPDVRARILPVPVLVTDDLQTLVAAEVDMLQQKEAAFGPLS